MTSTKIETVSGNTVTVSVQVFVVEGLAWPMDVVVQPPWVLVMVVLEMIVAGVVVPGKYIRQARTLSG